MPDSLNTACVRLLCDTSGLHHQGLELGSGSIVMLTITSFKRVYIRAAKGHRCGCVHPYVLQSPRLEPDVSDGRAWKVHFADDHPECLHCCLIPTFSNPNHRVNRADAGVPDGTMQTPRFFGRNAWKRDKLYVDLSRFKKRFQRCECTANSCLRASRLPTGSPLLFFTRPSVLHHPRILGFSLCDIVLSPNRLR